VFAAHPCLDRQQVTLGGREQLVTTPERSLMKRGK
jgi:hypothetical protein